MSERLATACDSVAGFQHVDVISKGCAPLYLARKCERCSEYIHAILARGDDGWEVKEFNSKCKHYPE